MLLEIVHSGVVTTGASPTTRILSSTVAQRIGRQETPYFPPRVYFNDFNPDSFNIRVIYWYMPPNYWDFLAFSEKVNVAIMRAFEEQGIQFSLPLRITYTTKDSQPRPLELKVVDESEAASFDRN